MDMIKFWGEVALGASVMSLVYSLLGLDRVSVAMKRSEDGSTLTQLMLGSPYVLGYCYGLISPAVFQALSFFFSKLGQEKDSKELKDTDPVRPFLVDGDLFPVLEEGSALPAKQPNPDDEDGFPGMDFDNAYRYVPDQASTAGTESLGSTVSSAQSDAALGLFSVPSDRTSVFSATTFEEIL